MKRVAISVAVVLLFLAAWVAASAAGAPQTSPTKQPEAPKQTQIRLVGTDQSPVVVAVGEAQRSEAKKQRDDEVKRLEERKEDQKERLDERKEKSSSDNELVWLTGILAAISAIQAYVFFKQWRAFRDTVEEMKLGTAATEKLANAAMKHALAVSHAERAYLFFEFRDGPTFRRLDAEGLIEIAVSVDIVNHGRTPAELIQVRAYPDVASSSPHEFIERPGSMSELPPGKALASGESLHLRFTEKITAAEVESVKNLGVGLYCLGLVKYWDIFREGVRETSVCAFFSDGRSDGVSNPVFILDPRSPLNKRT